MVARLATVESKECDWEAEKLQLDFVWWDCPESRHSYQTTGKDIRVYKQSTVILRHDHIHRPLHCACLPNDPTPLLHRDERKWQRGCHRTIVIKDRIRNGERLRQPSADGGQLAARLNGYWYSENLSHAMLPTFLIVMMRFLSLMFSST